MKYILEWRKFKMMNDKDLQRKKDEKIASIVMDLLKTGQIDEKFVERVLKIREISKHYNLEKVSDEYRRLKEAFTRITNNDIISGMICLTLQKNGTAIFTSYFDERIEIDSVSALPLMIEIGYEITCDDTYDDDKFEAFMSGVNKDVRAIRTFRNKVKRG